VSVYLDTSAILAVLDSDDAMHSRASSAWLSLMAGTEEVLTSNYVVVETSALLQRRFGLPALRRFVDKMLPAVSIVFVAPGLHERALSAVLAAGGRRAPSLVDCAGFEIIRERAVDRVLAFDAHFQNRGYTMAG